MCVLTHEEWTIVALTAPVITNSLSYGQDMRFSK